MGKHIASAYYGSRMYPGVHLCNYCQDLVLFVQDTPADHLSSLNISRSAGAGFTPIIIHHHRNNNNNNKWSCSLKPEPLLFAVTKNSVHRTSVICFFHVATNIVCLFFKVRYKGICSDLGFNTNDMARVTVLGKAVSLQS